MNDIKRGFCSQINGYKSGYSVNVPKNQDGI